MKVKKSMFAKLLALALPMAAISVVTPIVLTSCGSSTSETNKTQASWDTTKTQDGLTFDTTNNSAVITLGNNAFASTGISKASTFDSIKSSLEPTSTGTSLFSVLSGAIKDVGNYNVKLSVDTNPIVFDYSNDAIGNYFNGQFQLTPKSGSGDVINLNFRVNNFNDSYYGTSGSGLQWNVEAIKKVLDNNKPLDGTEGLPKETPVVTKSNNGASVTIDLSNQEDKVKGLGHVMDELCKPDSTITSNELKSFITTDNMSNYNIDGAKISNWAPSVDGTMVFTRIVVPNKTEGGRDAILYIAYTGLKKDKGNAAWNRNISYPGNANLWDSQYNEPIIDLSKVNGNIGDTSISNKSTKDQLTDKETITPLVEYMVKNYMMESGDFKLCFTGIKDKGTGHDTIVPGSFSNGVFTADSDSKKPSTASSIKDSAQPNNFSGKAIQLKVWLEDVDNTNSAHNSYGRGIWRAFYLINYSDAKNS